MPAEERALESIAVHARALEEVGGETTRNELHAEVCARRQIAFRDQELRAFVVKHSVVRIHWVVAVSLGLIAIALFACVGGQVTEDVLKALVLVASSAIGSSVWSISRAVGNSKSQCGLRDQKR